MVAEGVYPSISSVTEARLAQMMLQDEAPVDTLAGMADEIRRRMELPLDRWLPWDGKEMAQRVKKKLRAPYEE